MGENVGLSNIEMERLEVNLERIVMNQKVVKDKGDQVERDELVDIPITNETEKIPHGRHQVTWKRYPKEGVKKIIRSKQESIG